MRRISLILSLVLPACAEPSNVFRVSVDFSDSALAEMQEAADDLCVASGERHCYEMTRGDAPNGIVSRNLEDPDLAEQIKITPGTPFEAPTITISIDKPGAFRWRVAFSHELGHASGCRLHLPIGNVMTEWLEDSPASWTAADLACMD
jgi:hypothetical protein